MLYGLVPVLTVSGNKFASTVAGSLLTAANLNDLLIAKDLYDYEEKAVQFALNPSLLHDIKLRLNDRENYHLFDTVFYTAHLEQAYQLIINDMKQMNQSKLIKVDILPEFL